MKKNFNLIIKEEECKGCQRCINACPKNLIILGESLNQMGYVPVQYVGEGCIGCGNCFYACPEPGTITIIEKDNS